MGLFDAFQRLYTSGLTALSEPPSSSIPLSRQKQFVQTHLIQPLLRFALRRYDVKTLSYLLSQPFSDPVQVISLLETEIIHLGWDRNLSFENNKTNDENTSHKNYQNNGGWRKNQNQNHDRNLGFLAGIKTRGCPFPRLELSQLNSTNFQVLLARKQPFILSGALDEWGAVHRFTRSNLKREYGNLNVVMSEIPYASVFGDDSGMTPNDPPNNPNNPPNNPNNPPNNPNNRDTLC